MKKLYSFLFALVAMLALAPSSYAETPGDFANGLANKVLGIIKADTSEDKKQDELIQLFHENVDSAWMGRYVLGGYYRQASADQKKKFIDLYTDYVIYSYIPKFRLYSGEKMTVLKTIDEGDGIYTVKTSLATDKSSTGSVLVDYKVLKSGSSYKIVDIIGEGISLISTQRADFGGALANTDLDSFINKLADKVAYIKAHPQTQLKKDNVAKTPAINDSGKGDAAPASKGKQLGE